MTRERADQDRAYREANRERLRAQQRAYRDANREQIRARDKARRAANRQKIAARDKAYRAANIERLRAKNKTYKQANRDALRERARSQQMWGRHRLRPEIWAAMWQEQDGRCYLGGEPLSDAEAVCVDHDHSCCPPNQSCANCRRGLACRKCNTLIGFVGDDPARLRHIAANLQTAQARIAQRTPPPSQAELWSA